MEGLAVTLQARNQRSERSPFGSWLRSEPLLDSRNFGLSIVDIDWCVHRFKTRPGPDGKAVQHFMFIEEKRLGEKISPSQADTLGTVFRKLTPKKRGRWSVHSEKIWSDMAKSEVTVMYWGVHKLTFSGHGPEDSDLIRWDRKSITKEQLIKILRFELNPFTLNTRDDRLHHGGAKQSMLPFLSPAVPLLIIAATIIGLLLIQLKEVSR